MAKKTTTKKVEELETLVESEIVEVDESAVEKALSTKFTAPKKPETSTVVENTDSPEHFVEGEVPAGFRKTYGEEITNVSESEQVADLLEGAYEVISKEDGFRFFLKYIDGMRFTVLVPLRFSNADKVMLDTYKCDARSVVLKPGNTREQVVFHLRRVARHLGYAKNR